MLSSWSRGSAAARGSSGASLLAWRFPHKKTFCECLRSAFGFGASGLSCASASGASRRSTKRRAYGGPGLGANALRVPAVYLAHAFLAFLTIAAIHGMNNLRNCNDPDR